MTGNVTKEGLSKNYNILKHALNLARKRTEMIVVHQCLRSFMLIEIFQVCQARIVTIALANHNRNKN